ncbi:acyl-CoA dehydrogenase family protein [Siminovitchia terrae]|uniref:Acyl-CoA dehydrogenase n=1 Tax=Siminovitchia terrae TaxID=1914933 RepID=A0A429XCV0_SIMTE|nr:acyl-CoA dehydrogenase family protein [Siminovitchia terrae]RST61285.1 acyl-CoA dehydrogenase [Siminovitchia terrae]GIN89208.1 acyl-CoA dehydrogenase [Siminovitchia terrae]
MTTTIKEAKPSLEEVKSQIRKIIDLVIRPNADWIDREGEFPSENLKALGEEGWNSILLPKELGGLALDYHAYGLVVREIAKACPSTALVYTMNIGASLIIYGYGNEDQWNRWLKPLREGKIGTIANSERATGSQHWLSESKADYTNGGYLLNFEKSFATSSGYADFYIIQTKSPKAEVYSDLSYFIVDAKQDGIETGKWDALGVRGNHSSPIKLNNIYVDQRDLIGEEGTGKKIVENSNAYIFGLGGAWTGTAIGLFKEAASFATKASGKHQVVRHQLASAKILIDSLCAWQNEIASRLNDWSQSGEPLSDELRTTLYEFKVHASETANQVAQISMDVAGGFGYKKGILERLYRDSRAGIVMGPSNNLAKELIGKQIVGIDTSLWPEENEQLRRNKK